MAIGLVLVVLISMLVFISTLALGDPAEAVLGRSATPAATAELRKELGLDRPVVEQYLSWASAAVHGDFGVSLSTRQPVSEYLGGRLLNTLQLALVTLAVMVPLALFLGVRSAIRPGGLFDQVVSWSSLAAISLPEFVVGTVLALVFAVQLELIPPVSLIPPHTSPLLHPDLLVLPVSTLTLVGLAYLSRMIRAGVIEAMESEYVSMARLNGLPERRVIWSHGLRNSLATTVQVLAATVQWLVVGTVVTETVFAYPGFGLATLTAVHQRDLTVVQAATLTAAVAFILINIVADVVVVLLIPKLRTQQ